MDAPQPAPHQLTYGSQPPSYRRWLRLFLVVVVFGGLAVSFWLFKGSIQHWQAKREYRRESEAWYASILNRVEAPTVLKYTDELSDAPPGGFKSSVSGIGFLIRQDPKLDRLPMFTGNGDPILASDNRILFSQERTNRDGITSLLMIDMCFWQGTKIYLETYRVGRQTAGPMAGQIGLLQGRGVAVEMAGMAKPGSLRLYAGQPDPVDRAKFYIPFASNGRRGRICGTFSPGEFSSKNPNLASIEADINAQVDWSVVPDAPTTQEEN